MVLRLSEVPYLKKCSTCGASYTQWWNTLKLLTNSFKIFQHTNHNVCIFAKRFARIFLRLHQLQEDEKKNSNYRYRERVDFMDFTDTKPESNWYQLYTNYKWRGTKWKAYRLLVLSLDIEFVKKVQGCWR